MPISSELAEELSKLPRNSLIFLTHSGGKPYKPETFGNWFKDRCVEAGLVNCSAHGLRKSLATLMANSGKSPDEIRAVLAHKTNSEGMTYTKKADRARLADSGLAGLSGTKTEQPLSNLSGRLGKREGK